MERIIPLNLVVALRAAGPLCRACGVPHDADAVGDGATLDDLEAVLDLLQDAVRRARPEGEVDRREAQVRQVRQLAAGGWEDPRIGRILGLSERTVRRIRKVHGIPAGLAAGTGPPRSGWEERLRAAHARGLAVGQLSELLGWSRKTVRARLSRLGLKARRSQGPGSGWEARLRAAHARGLTVLEIASLLGWARTTVWSRLSRLKLKARRSRKAAVRKPVRRIARGLPPGP